jgi:hypothetical protein
MNISTIVTLICVFSAFMSVDAKKPESLDVLESFLNVTFGDVSQEMRTCIVNAENIMYDINYGIKNFTFKDEKHVNDGLKSIGSALVRMQNKLKHCEELSKLFPIIQLVAEEFLNPQELVVKSGSDIKWFDYSIGDDIMSSIHNLENKNYAKYGRDIGNIMNRVFTGSNRDYVIDAENFLEGFFEGALEEESIDITDCLTDAADVIEELEDIIETIKESGISDPEKLIFDFIDLISEAVKSVVDCENAPAELELMLEWIEAMKNISTMTHKIFIAFLQYSTRIREDFDTTLTAYKIHKFRQIGLNLGDFLHILFIDVASTGVIEYDLSDIRLLK